MRPALRVLLLLFLSVVVTLPALAQEAADTDSLLAMPGMPEVVIRAENGELEIPSNLRSARTLIRFDNATDRTLHPLLLRLPADIGVERALGDLQSGVNGPPGWLLDATYPGFVGETPSGRTSYAVIDLVAGDYVLVANDVISFEVTGASSIPPAQQMPAADVEARVFDHSFSFPLRIEPGRQVWAITNTGNETHEIVLAWSPDVMTTDEMVAAMGLDGEGTPPEGLTPPVTIGGMGWLSPGETAWTELDLAPGSYLVLCLVYDPDIRATHFERGMVDSFTIAPGTPEAATPEG
ncbi:MAG TPA: hypothetical protein VKZ61_18080 [Thermomicrobiales bacterium]|nr:hypothetical protein [Thermomicrobiales bacterium]